MKIDREDLDLLRTRAREYIVPPSLGGLRYDPKPDGEVLLSPIDGTLHDLYDGLSTYPGYKVEWHGESILVTVLA
jgi:hypothetical protein